jgi:hypothetical protein
MKKFRIGLILAAIAIIVAELFIADLKKFFISPNLGPFLSTLSMLMVILSQIYEIRKSAGKQD